MRKAADLWYRLCVMDVCLSMMERQQELVEIVGHAEALTGEWAGLRQALQACVQAQAPNSSST